MKKITFLFLFSLCALSIQAQNYYTVSTSQQTYTNLENSTSLNNNQVWVYDQYGPVNIPFNFSIAGKVVNKFLFEDDYFALVTPNGNYEQGTGVYYINITSGYLQDRTFSTGTSSSPISYKIEGTTGNRILKLEIKNAGLENAQELNFSEDHFYLNAQIWLYEVDNTIEIRYGDHNISNISYVTDEDGRSPLLGIEEGDTKVYMLYGQSTNPTYGEYTEQTIPQTLTSDSFPANGTVYKLSHSQTAGLENFSTSTFSLYPNPASSVLHLKSNNIAVSEYAIYNVIGKLVTTKKIAESNDVEINIDNLEEGIYFINVNNQHLKFIKHN